MASWQDVPNLHFPNSTYLDSLSNDTDPYTIYYGQAAIVSPKLVTIYGILNISGIILLLFLIGTILLSGKRIIPNSIKSKFIELNPKSTTTTNSNSNYSTRNNDNQQNQNKRNSKYSYYDDDGPERSSKNLRIQRDPCLINAFLVIILVNLLNLLYWLSNKGKINGHEILYLPHPTLCRAQAILQAGSQSAQMSVVLSVVLRLWLKTVTLTRPYFDKFRGRGTLIFLLALPYLFVISFIPRMIVLTKIDNTPVLIPTPFYCSLLDLHIRRSYQILTGVIAILTLIMELWVIYLITSHFRRTTRITNLANQSLNSKHNINIKLNEKNKNELNINNITKPQRLLKRSFYIRISLFVFWTMGMIMATLYQAFDKTITDPNSDLVFACMGLIAFICFSTQIDILRAWNIPTDSDQWKLFFRRLFRLNPSDRDLNIELSKKDDRIRNRPTVKQKNRTTADPDSDSGLVLQPPNRRGFISFQKDTTPSGIPHGVIIPTPPELDLHDFIGESTTPAGFNPHQHQQNGHNHDIRSRDVEEIIIHSPSTKFTDGESSQPASDSTMSKGTITTTTVSQVQSESTSSGSGKDDFQYYENIYDRQNNPIQLNPLQKQPTGLGLGINSFNMTSSVLPLNNTNGMIVSLQEGMEIEQDVKSDEYELEDLVVNLDKNVAQNRKDKKSGFR
ncbi:uncharacterized protein L201_001656 [Kwoniella dendrophila CBS 6074]|uniref:G-protein coupled receptors family 1 profile domain-containing protein n=1 Tax=Kwoniella dendrophila CBS 6074 TaxID=1295534 RepID=A0AAX4JN25_9TREE